MPGRVAVAAGLTPVSQAFRDAGWDVVELRSGMDLEGIAVCVVSGGDDNLMGMQDIQVDAPVIDAAGRTAREVVEQAELYVQRTS